MAHLEEDLRIADLELTAGEIAELEAKWSAFPVAGYCHDAQEQANVGTWRERVIVRQWRAICGSGSARATSVIAHWLK
jgi:hypothetical protein